TKLITYEESLTMPENRLEEIIDGESYIMPPATKKHWMLLSRLRRLLEGQLSETGYRLSSGEVGLGIRRVPAFTCRNPDLAVYSIKALARDEIENKKYNAYVWTPPELLAECLSPSNRKGRIEKLREDYESIGVPELWLIDPQKQVLSVYRLEGGSLNLRDAVEHGAVRPAQLPGIEIEVDQLWEAFDLKL
ncbi:MAG: Uma2 family endonuclease, partial [Acidobacteriota bacterium]|nr:Uma2 family endonuclease [Acidobacteriota bacterium]